MKRCGWAIILVALAGLLGYQAGKSQQAGPWSLKTFYQEAINLLCNPVRASDGREVLTDSAAAVESWQVTDAPTRWGLKRPAWPPRFEDAGIDEPRTPSPPDPSRGGPNGVGSDGILFISDLPAVRSSGALSDQSEVVPYPSTGRPEFPPEPSRLRPVFDPMQTDLARLPPADGGHQEARSEITSGSAGPLAQWGGVVSTPGGQVPTLIDDLNREVAPRKPTTEENVGPFQPSVRLLGEPTDASRATPSGEVMISDTSSGVVPAAAVRSANNNPALLASPNLNELRPEICEHTQVLARVGSEVILAGEILAAVNEILASYRDKVPPAVYERYKQQVMRQLLERRIEVKLIYEDIKRKIPAENLKRIEEEIVKFFNEKEVPARIRKMGLSSVQEWEARLRSVGSSLEHEKRIFIEASLARDWIKQQIGSAGTSLTNTSPEKLWEYYQAHLADFEQPAEVRWQQLMVKKRPDRSDAEAYAKLAELGNRVLNGEPFEEVARFGSEGPTASEGGLREPVQPGSLRSTVLDQALFSLPVGQLSPILEDDQGFHIVRVLERREARRIPFTEAQVEIRRRLEEEEKQKQLASYLEKLRREIPVWNALEEAERNKLPEAATAPLNGSWQQTLR